MKKIRQPSRSVSRAAPDCSPVFTVDEIGEWLSHFRLTRVDKLLDFELRDPDAGIESWKGRKLKNAQMESRRE